MSYETQKVRIGFSRDVARKVTKKYKLYPPVDVINVAESEGFEIEYEQLAVCAQFNRFEKFIVVNKKDHLNRQRFSIAHELGHFYLHHDMDYHSFNGRTDDFGRFRTVQENEAFEFARELLVPLTHINQYLKEGLSIDEMALRFLVSKEVMFISLKSHNKI